MIAHLPRQSLSIIAVILSLWSAASAQEDLQNPRYLGKVVTSFASQNRPQEIYLFLENEFPDFFRTLDRAGLAAYLDSVSTQGDFEKAWQGAKAEYLAGGGKIPEATLEAMYEAFRQGVSVRPAAPVAPEQRVSALVAERASPDYLEKVRGRLYEAEGHPLRKAGWAWMRQVEMAEIPGEVWWYNDLLSIPKLGIKPGVPWTAEQKAAFARFFSVRVANEVPGGKVVGTANYPADVGRSVNVRGDVLPVVNGENGEVFPEVTLKGIGVTPRTPVQRIWTSLGPAKHGHFLPPKAVTEAEVGRALQEAGARAHMPVAIIRFPNEPGRVIHVRAQPSVARLSPHLEPQGYEYTAAVPDANDRQANLRILIEYLAANAGLMTGKGRPLTIREWAEDFLPRVQGRNAGIADRVGFQHTDHEGNLGPADMMDFGESDITRWRNPRMISQHRDVVKRIVYQTNRLLPPGEQIDSSKAAELFDASVKEGQRAAERFTKGLPLSRQWLGEIDDYHLKDLTSGYPERALRVGRSESRSAREALLREFRALGLSLPGRKEAPVKWLLEQLKEAGFRESVSDLAVSTDPAARGILARLAVERRLMDATGAEKMTAAELADRIMSGRGFGPIFNLEDPEAREFLLREFDRRGLKLWTPETIPLSKLADLVVQEVDYGPEQSRRRILEVIRSYDTARYEKLRDLPLDDLRALARRRGIAKPEELNRSQLARMLMGRAAYTHPMNRAVGGWAWRQVAGAGQFGAAYAVKEGAKALWTRDPEGLRAMKEPGFWGSVMTFGAGAWAVDRGLGLVRLRGWPLAISKGVFPLAGGMVAVQAVSGHLSWREVGLGTAAYSAAGMMVNVPVDFALRPVLMALGAPKWAMGAYGIVRLAGVLAVGEWLERRLQARFSTEHPSEGVRQKMAALGGDH